MSCNFHLSDEIRQAIEDAIIRAARRRECSDRLTICIMRSNGMVITLRSTIGANELDSGTALIRASVALDVASGKEVADSIARHARRISQLFSSVHIASTDDGNVSGTAVFRVSDGATILAALAVVAPTPELACEFAKVGMAVFKRRLRIRSNAEVAEEVL
ncbi:MAG: hypothetical protein HGA38_02385 [Candidatus Moranbacteria bacterium]|nr:hypothetical protein [Candidatus Moranbacteria bacterium]NTW45735.1 hypothetical protein [Candidatus Moranbacteria bacterium]